MDQNDINRKNSENIEAQNKESVVQNKESDSQNVFDNATVEAVNEQQNVKSEQKNKNGDRKTRRVSVGMTVFIALLAALIAFQTTYVALTSSYKVKLNKAYENVSRFAALFEAYDIFDKNYIYDINDDNLIDYMLYSFASEDKYFSYYNAEEWAEMTNTHIGISYGIGVYVSYDGNDGILVGYVMKDSPAEKAGLKYKDVIVAIDGVYVADVGYDNAVNLVAGEKGTVVNITVIRDGVEKNIAVTRGEYSAETVISETMVLEDGSKIGYIRLLEFYTITVSQFKNAVNTLINDGCKGIVFDLRDNPGGELSAIIDILDFLLPEGPIVHILDANKNEIETYKSDKNEIDIPMAVLVNGNTASAAELFTSALRDYKKADIIGTKTYGKGCGQSVYALSNGGYIYVTSFFYNPPYGDNYDGIGIYPNIEVKLSDEYANTNLFFVPHEYDAQLGAAIRNFTK